MTFGYAIEWVKNGERVERKGWNGKGMWICLIKPGTAMHLGFDMQPCIALKTADNKMQPGWAPSQQDMLADDWEIIR